MNISHHDYRMSLDMYDLSPDHINEFIQWTERNRLSQKEYFNRPKKARVTLYFEFLNDFIARNGRS